ncbi:MAG TPA: DNA-binding protein, partial [Candidatus Aenigmarchaeota archaeon]|nr:DNA-binding protein [Candidatus Aenigmarchaeota archaeon]
MLQIKGIHFKRFFDWEKKTYKELTIRRGLEITSYYGNIARKENDEPLIHMHGTFSDEEDRVYGGHVKTERLN